MLFVASRRDEVHDRQRFLLFRTGHDICEWKTPPAIRRKIQLGTSRDKESHHLDVPYSTRTAVTETQPAMAYSMGIEAGV